MLTPRPSYGRSGNNFILPVIPDHKAQGMLGEQLEFNVTSCI
jgi:hypothetical protein